MSNFNNIMQNLPKDILQDIDNLKKINKDDKKTAMKQLTVVKKKIDKLNLKKEEKNIIISEILPTLNAKEKQIVNKFMNR